MYRTRPKEFGARFTFILPENCRHLIDPKKLKLRQGRIKFNGNRGAATETNCEASEKVDMKPAPLQGKASLLWEIRTPDEEQDERGYTSTDRFFKEEEVKSAVEWFKKQAKKEAVSMDSKGDYVRLEDVVELVERAFGGI